MSYTYNTSSLVGDTNSSSCLRVNVFATTSCGSWAIDAAYNGIVDAQDQIYSETNIPGVEVNQYTSTDFTHESSDESTERGRANQWLTDNGFYERSHNLFVSDKSMGMSYGNAWNSRCVAFIGESQVGGSLSERDRMMGVCAAHEALHGYLQSNSQSAADLMNSGNNEHSLGQVYLSKGKASPMVSSYASNSDSNYAETGQCDDFESINWGEWVKDLTDCATSALDYCYEYEKSV